MKSYFNFLRRNALYTAVNLLGLAVSLAFVLLVGVYLSGELTVEGSNPNRERIYNFRGDGTTTQAAPVAKDIEAFFPQVEKTLRVLPMRLKTQWADGSKELCTIQFVDSTFFDFFPQRFVLGDPATALLTRDRAVLCNRYATSKFGSPAEAMGQTIVVDGVQYIVSAVIETPDRSSLIDPDIEVWTHFENITHTAPFYLASYGAANFPIFVMLHPGASIDKAQCEAFAQKLSEYYWLFQDGRNKEAIFMPLSDYYWGNAPIAGIRAGNPDFLSVLVLCALLVLGFALINYINLTVAQTYLRARQAALRRLLGCSRGRVFGSFMIESLAMCSLAMGLALLTAWAAAPWFFSEAIGEPVDFLILFSPLNLLGVGALLLVLSVLTGVAPAWVAGRVRPIQIVRGDFSRRSKTIYSRLMIGFQFAATTVLVGVAWTIERQTNYMLSAEVGFRKDQLLVVQNTLNSKRAEAFPNLLRRIPGVHSVSLGQGAPFVSQSTFNISIENEPHSFRYFAGDTAYIEVLGLEAVRHTGVRDTAGVWINETAARRLNVASDATDIPWGENHKLPLRGILKDFRLGSLAHPMEAAIVADLRTGFGEPYPYEIFVRLDASNPIEAKKQIEAAWREFSGGELFHAYYMDQRIEETYVAERRTAAQVGMLSVLALVVAAMGILAASIYAVRQQRKEIAVRKTYGSSVGEVFGRIIRSYLVVWAVAMAVALPAVGWIGGQWLTGFADRIALTWDLYASAAGVVLAVVLLTLSVQTWKAARTDPAVSLKTE